MPTKGTKEINKTNVQQCCQRRHKTELRNKNWMSKPLYWAW